MARGLSHDEVRVTASSTFPDPALFRDGGVDDEGVGDAVAPEPLLPDLLPLLCLPFAGGLVGDAVEDESPDAVLLP